MKIHVEFDMEFLSKDFDIIVLAIRNLTNEFLDDDEKKSLTIEEIK